MGTSRGYRLPTGGNWGPLKTDATQFVQAPGASAATPKSLLRDYVRANGGSTGIISGRGSGGRGGRGGGRRSGGAVRTAQALGGFLSSAASGGLGLALTELGLGHLI